MVLLYSAVHGLATTSRQLRAVGDSAVAVPGCPRGSPARPSSVPPVTSSALSDTSRKLPRPHAWRWDSVGVCAVPLPLDVAWIHSSAPRRIFPTTNTTPGSAVKDLVTSARQMSTLLLLPASISAPLEMSNQQDTHSRPQPRDSCFKKIVSLRDCIIRSVIVASVAFSSCYKSGVLGPSGVLVRASKVLKYVHKGWLTTYKDNIALNIF